MALLHLTQGGLTDLDLTADGDTDSISFSDSINKNLQIVRSEVDNVGQPLLTFQISNDGVNWVSWEVEGFIFKDITNMFEFTATNKTLFRVSWLTNSSTGTFTANFNTV